MELPTSTSPARAFVAGWRQLAEGPQSEADGPTALRPIAVAIVASFTVEPLVPYLGCFLARRGLLAHFQVAPFNQIYQSLLDPASPVRAAGGLAQVTIVLPRLEELCPAALRTLAELFPAEVDGARQQALKEVDRLAAALGEFERGTAGLLLCGTLPPARTLPLGVLDASHGASQEHLRAELNLRLWQHARASSRTRLFDLAGAVGTVGTAAAYDDRLFYLSRCPFSEGMLRHLGQALSRAVAPLFVSPAKVAVLDLDNTLWGGIVGEDGLHGIVLSESGPGAAYGAFQEALLQLRRQGVLLCIASKNNEADAFEIFDRHPGMRLRREHLSAWRIGWQSKSESLRQLAKELSLGLSSLVFIDDSPTECEEVRRMLPEVTVVELPKDPAHFVTALRGVAVLDRMTLTAEDRLRADQYAAERRRTEARESAPDGSAESDPASLKAYLASLELKVTVRPLLAADVPRAAQLTQKTNQFNLTTVRRTEAEVEALRQDPAYRLYVLEVSDRFGDYGLTGVLFIEEQGRFASHFAIDTLLLSCRVLGRGVETAFLKAAVADLLALGGGPLIGRFVPTAKNAPAAGFLAGHGFHKGEGDAWVLPDLALLGASLDVPHITLTATAAGQDSGLLEGGERS